jgi:cytochrome c oxidase subunit II
VWTLVPGAILLYLAQAQLDTWAELRAPARRPPGPPLARVWATQFDWRFQYPGADGRFDTLDDLEEPFELVVPAGEPVVLELVSRDVIHSFFVPALRLKQDVVPGLAGEAWFEARETGEFDVECAELCGAGHYKMAGRLRVVPRALWDEHLAALARAWSDGEGAGAR